MIAEFQINGHPIRSREVSYMVREVNLDGAWVDIVELYNYLEDVDRQNKVDPISAMLFREILEPRQVVQDGWKKGINFDAFKRELIEMLR